MSFEFNTKAHTLKSLPKDRDQLVKQADDLVESITSKKWSRNKEYHYTLDDHSKESVTTYHTKISKEHWVSRVSTHDDAKYPFDKMIGFLLGCENKAEEGYVVDDLYKHTEYEMGYIEVLNKWEKVPLEKYPGYESLESHDHLKDWYSVITEYELGAPLTTRQFNEFILIVPPSATYPTKAFVISVVADNSGQVHDNVQGVYSSIERVELNKEKGTWEWRMCTCSDAGGNVPKWVQNAMISKNVAMDVPNFLNWVSKQ